ncbi:MAG: phosphate ABC transporter permease PstA [Armatimonadetes bacterium]|nr:phosphate ABC transporter permease PstA [Armatimonadota bacterium]
METPRGWRDRQSRNERLFQFIAALVVLFALGVLVTLLAKTLLDGASRLGWDFLTSYPSRRAANAGILPALIGSFYLMILTAIISIPIGIGAAIYLEEFGKRNAVSSFIEINISNLAGVPSIIYGLLGLQVFVRFLQMERSLLAGACTLSLLALPVIITASRESLRSVPRSIREGSLALGATQWQTVQRQTLPIAFPSMLTGVILALSRVIGETAPIITIGAFAMVTQLPNNLFAEFTALPIQVFDWVSRPQKAFHENSAAAVIVLLALLLTMNAIAIWLRNRYQKQFNF